MSRSVTPFLARAISQTLPHLAVFAVMLLAFASGATSSWQCEGQMCGASAWTCCCALPADAQDAECSSVLPHFTRGEHFAEAGECKADCHCTMTVQSNGPSVASAHFSFAAPPLLWVPVKFAPTFEAPDGTESPRPPVSRGPPLKAVHFAALSLRGPPVA